MSKLLDLMTQRAKLRSRLSKLDFYHKHKAMTAEEQREIPKLKMQIHALTIRINALRNQPSASAPSHKPDTASQRSKHQGKHSPAHPTSKISDRGQKLSQRLGQLKGKFPDSVPSACQKCKVLRSLASQSNRVDLPVITLTSTTDKNGSCHTFDTIAGDQLIFTFPQSFPDAQIIRVTGLGMLGVGSEVGVDTPITSQGGQYTVCLFNSDDDNDDISTLQIQHIHYIPNITAELAGINGADKYVGFGYRNSDAPFTPAIDCSLYYAYISKKGEPFQLTDALSPAIRPNVTKNNANAHENQDTGGQWRVSFDEMFNHLPPPEQLVTHFGTIVDIHGQIEETDKTTTGHFRKFPDRAFSPIGTTRRRI